MAKLVYSTITSAAKAAVRELVAAAPADVSVGGPHLAAEAIRADLVD